MNTPEVPVRRLARIRLAVFALGVAVSLLWAFVLWPRQSAVMQSQDIYNFAELGSHIANGQGFAYEPGRPTLRRAPFYPTFIAGLYLLFGHHLLVVQIAQCLLAGGICLLAFELGRMLFSLRTGGLAAVFCAFHPMVFRYAADVQVENLLTFLVTLMVWSTVRFHARPGVGRGALVGVTGALAALTKGVAVAYPPVFVLFYALHRSRAHQPVPWAGLIAVLLAMGALILPWTARNMRVTGGRFVLISSNAGGEFLRGYVFAQPKYYLLLKQPYVDGEVEANTMQADLFRRHGMVWEQDEVQTETLQNQEAKKKLLADPLGFLRKSFILFFMFWYVVTSRMNSLLVGGLALAGWLLALAGWPRARREGRDVWLLFLPILTLNLVYAAMLALGRYSAPCIPALMVLAAWGMETWRSRAALPMQTRQPQQSA